MIAAWMLYTLLVGALLALGAWSAESLLRLAGRPARWVWGVALLATLGFTANAARERLEPTVIAPTLKVPATIVAPSIETVTPSALASALTAARRFVALPVELLLGGAARGAPTTLGPLLLGGWLLLGAGAALVHLLAYARVGRARRGWPAIDLEGERVRLAQDMGPAVVGLTRPEVVVPHWLLARPTEERRLVLAHEREHVRAHDPLLLAAGCAAAVALAWNPAAWWMLARLRLAVEMDCDRRVLRRGVSTRPYASLLIELAGHDAGLPAGAPALAGRRTHLERRLLAMTTRRTRFPLARGGALGALALTAILAACESKLPTAAEVEQMDVAAVEQRVDFATIADTKYFVDGVETTPEMARNLAPTEIESVSVLKAKVAAGADPSRAPKSIEIVTKKAAQAGMLPSKRALTDDALAEKKLELARMNPSTLKDKVSESEMVITSDEKMRKAATGAPLYIVDGSVVDGSAINEPTRASGGAPRKAITQEEKLRKLATEVPLFLIDGKVVAPDAIHQIAKESIESVEVIKGEASTRLYGAEGKNGVVKITTKKQ